MKIKTLGLSKKRFTIDRKITWVFYVITLVAAVCLRTDQLMTNMNFSTGKYITNDITAYYPALTIAAGLFIILLILRFGSSNDRAVKTAILMNPYKLKCERLNKKQSNATAIFFLVMSLLIAIELFMNISFVISKNIKLSTEDNPVFFLSGISTLDWFIYVFQITALITFLTSGYNILKGDGFTKGNCFFFSVYSVMRILQIFAMIKETQLIALFSEKTFIMLSYMCSAVFFTFTARYFFDCENKNTKLWMCFFGFATSILSAVSVIPRYVMYFLINYMQREGMASPNISDIGWILIPPAVISLFFGQFVYRIMPKLNISGKRRWSAVPTGQRTT